MLEKVCDTTWKLPRMLVVLFVIFSVTGGAEPPFIAVAVAGTLAPRVYRGTDLIW